MSPSTSQRNPGLSDVDAGYLELSLPSPIQPTISGHCQSLWFHPLLTKMWSSADISSRSLPRPRPAVVCVFTASPDESRGLCFSSFLHRLIILTLLAHLHHPGCLQNAGVLPPTKQKQSSRSFSPQLALSPLVG